MLLSIVMMVKNEERNLDKTLNALRPLMEEINSELVILDTGSTDSTVDIARKYTDKVFFAKWNDNFSDMRNISISYAKGDWILILDADEELINYEKLKEFFDKSLFNKYNSASINLKNILSLDKKSYSMTPLIRMFKNSKDFRYEGAIHEQPKFKHPIYNNVALFDHYGYLFENEEIKQLKDNRNKNILLKEIKKEPNNPYINYQLGKTYSISKNYEDAIYYMEKGYDLYTKIKYIPIFVTLDLAMLYLEMNEFDKCESLCTKYIKNDNKNIDIYYYLATSQKYLRKYKRSLENYKRYLYLIENYDISTQANAVECNADTLIYQDKAKVNIIDIYYKLEMYQEIINNIDDININILEQAYLVIFMSLYKLNQEEKIIEIYKNLSSCIVQQNKFKVALESILKRIKEEDLPKMYKMLSKIDGNYGTLNKIRLGEKLTIEQYNEILTKEQEIYYADIIYYAMKGNLQLEDILKNISNLKMQGYIDYLVSNKRDFIFDLYDYLDNTLNTLDIKKLQIYSCVSKSLLTYGGLVGKKYENLFLMYITYTYDYLKQLYNTDLEDDDLLNLLKNEDEIFIISINRAQKLSKTDKLEYVKKMKDLLIKNQKYKKGIEILIEKFKNEFDINEELNSLKKQYKSIIQNDIEVGNIIGAKENIYEYESIFEEEEAEILNLKAIIKMLEGKFEESDKMFKNSYLLDRYNYNVVFNIGCIKEILGQYEDATKYFELIVKNCEDENIVLESKEKIMIIN